MVGSSTVARRNFSSSSSDSQIKSPFMNLQEVLKELTHYAGKRPAPRLYLLTLFSRMFRFDLLSPQKLFCEF